ncbi:MAG: glycosyltransferase family 2 protein [Sharpea porci]|uniref:glycosyltransferase family 2 protein n=1 Tax=Sharpea porci TaxID=2652286 RepID=UPI00240A5246|nr:MULTISPECIES: glycosyltransferase family 2 protein [Coprobacillaceae]MDD6594905.1 glycosyltransferase family 2 protein [Catenibacterium mitsuokai]MDD6710492.1 glycosyltransferase family 2 protein [Sharpea porci]
MIKTLIIIPAYNEALNIKNTIEDIEENAPGADYIVINDGSKDDTLEKLNLYNFHYINGFQNQGLFGAVQTGFKWALYNDYDVAIQFDGDGQHSAIYIKDLVKAIEEGNNISIGSRYVNEKKPITARMLGSRLITFAIKVMTGKKVNDPTSGFRAYDRSCIKLYADDINNPPEPDTLVYMLKNGKKIKEVQVTMSEREFGESYLNPINSIKYMVTQLISIFLIQSFRKVDR